MLSGAGANVIKHFLVPMLLEFPCLGLPFHKLLYDSFICICSDALYV